MEAMDQELKDQEHMDVSDNLEAPSLSLNTLTPAQRRPLPKKLEHIFSRKSYLQNKLYRAEHHLLYFNICEKSDRFH